MERLFSTAVTRKRTEPLLIMDDDFVLACQFETVSSADSHRGLGVLTAIVGRSCSLS